jgi:hypothetical protein
MQMTAKIIQFPRRRWADEDWDAPSVGDPAIDSVVHNAWILGASWALAEPETDPAEDQRRLRDALHELLARARRPARVRQSRRASRTPRGAA